VLARRRGTYSRLPGGGRRRVPRLLVGVAAGRGGSRLQWLPRRRRRLLLRHSTARSAPIHHRRQPRRTIAGNKLACGYGGAAPMLDATYGPTREPLRLPAGDRIGPIMHPRDRAAKDNLPWPQKTIASSLRPLPSKNKKVC
jgi:hypothetical protein